MAFSQLCLAYSVLKSLENLKKKKDKKDRKKNNLTALFVKK